MFILIIILNSFLFLFISFILYCFGRRINKILFLKIENLQDRYFNIPLSLVSGLYSLSLLLSILYFFWNINKYSSYLIIIIIILVSFPEFKFSFKEIITFLKRKNYSFYFLISYLLFYFYFIQLSLPEITWDALAYHLLPAGSTEVYFSHNFGFYNSLPKGLDVLFWFGNVLSNEYFLPKYFHFVFFFTLLIFVGLFSYNYISKRFYWIPVVFIFIHPMAINFASSSYVDFGNSSLEIFSLLFIYIFIVRKEIIYLIWSIAFLCYGVSIKYTSLMASVSLFIALILFLYLFKSRIKYLKFKCQSRNIIPILYFAILPFIFFIKNWILLGNPLWPFYFGHEGMPDTEFYSLTISNLQRFTFEKSFSSYFLLPIRIITNNYEAHNLSTFQDLINNFNFLNLDLGMIALVFCFIFYLSIKNRKFFNLLCLFIFISFVFNLFFGSHQIRYILSSFLLLSFFPLFLLRINFINKYKFLSNILSIIIIISLILSKFSMIKDTLKYFNPNGRDQFLLNLHDYDLNLMLIENNISTKQVAYPFELNSYRYFKNYENLSNSLTLGLGLSNDIQADLQILNKNKIKYWITNSMTTNWRKDWLKDPHYDNFKRLEKLISLDKEILSRGNVITNRNSNTLVEIPND